MLGHRESVLAIGLPIPTGDASKPVGDVLDLDVERRGVEQVEPSPAQHALPGARSGVCRNFMHHSAVPIVKSRLNGAIVMPSIIARPPHEEMDEGPSWCHSLRWFIRVQLNRVRQVETHGKATKIFVGT